MTTTPERAEARASAQTRVRWELLVHLVRKDLKVKYQGSTLGFFWSLANPLLLFAVYTFVFQVVFKSGIPAFGVYLMSGLLIWSAFQNSVSYASGSVVANAGLVKKVRFPLPVLPLSSVGFAAVHFVLQIGLLFVVMLAIGYDDYSFLSPRLLLLVPAMVVTVTFALGLSFLTAALNVRYRDTAHLVEVSMIAWFWLNPIVYASGLAVDKLGSYYLWYFVNPMAGVVATFQRALYVEPYYTNNQGVRTLLLADPGYLFYVKVLGLGMAVSLVVLWFGLRVFRRLQADFAEEL